MNYEQVQAILTQARKLKAMLEGVGITMPALDTLITKAQSVKEPEVTIDG